MYQVAMKHKILPYIVTLIILFWRICAKKYEMVKYIDPLPISRRFNAEGFCPHVIPNPPNYTIMMSFAKNATVVPGIVLPYTDVRRRPKARWKAPNDTVYYTMISCSPDIPCDELPHVRYSEFYPYIVRNIPGMKISLGEELLPWKLPENPRRPDELFYIMFVLYRQNGLIHGNVSYIEDEEWIEDGKFRVRKYARLQNLTEPPEAGNYFLLCYED